MRIGTIPEISASYRVTTDSIEGSTIGVERSRIRVQYLDVLANATPVAISAVVALELAIHQECTKTAIGAIVSTVATSVSTRSKCVGRERWTLWRWR